jgi:hypothetical protein
MGTVWTGPKPCGRRAKFRMVSGPFRKVEFLCGIHERQLRLRSWGYSVSLHSGHSERSTGTIASAESPPAESPATRGQV